MDAISVDLALRPDRTARGRPHGRDVRDGYLGPGAGHDELRDLHDSGNDRAPIAQRGHTKQKRTDLRLVGLGLVVSTDGGVPLVSPRMRGTGPM